MNKGIEIGELSHSRERASNAEKITNACLLLIIALFLLYPLIFVGFTTQDDADISINYGSVANLLDTTVAIAKSQGRVTYLWGYPLLRVPFLVDNPIWYVATKLGALLLLGGALYFAVKRIFRSSWLSFLVLSTFLIFIQNGWEHNGLTSYAFAFNIYATLFLCSIGVFAIALDRSNLLLTWIAAFLLFFSMGIELFVLFFPFYIGIIYSRVSEDRSFASIYLIMKRYLTPIIIVLILYLCIYLAWRVIHPSEYDGASLNANDIHAAIRVIATYSFNAFPITSINVFLKPELRAQLAGGGGLREFISHLELISFLKPVIVSLLFFRLLSVGHYRFPSGMLLSSGVIFSLAGIFLPNLLLGFVQKHQAWVSEGSSSYLYTYYSFVSAVVLVSLVVGHINKKSLKWRAGLRGAFLAVVLTSVAVVSFAVELRNIEVSFEQKLSNRKWELMAELVKSEELIEIPEGSTIVAPTLTMNQRGIVAARGDYWEKYVKYHSGKHVRFSDESCIDGVPCYFLKFEQNGRADTQFIVFSKIQNSKTPTTNEMTLFSILNRSNYVIIGSMRQRSEFAKLALDGSMILNVGGGLFSATINSSNRPFDIQKNRLASDVDMFPDLLVMGGLDAEPRMQPFSVKLGDGFYSPEIGARSQSWAWSKGHSTLEVTSYAESMAFLAVHFETRSLEPIEVKVVGATTPNLAIMPGPLQKVEFSIHVPPGITEVELIPNKLPILPGNGDQRELSFTVTKLQVALSEKLH